jgi:hypothetical protein
MLHRSKRIWKQTSEYGAIADAYRRKHLKMLENFVVRHDSAVRKAQGIYSTKPCCEKAHAGPNVTLRLRPGRCWPICRD